MILCDIVNVFVLYTPSSKFIGKISRKHVFGH